MIAELKKLLAEAHVSAGDKVVKVLGDSEIGYLMKRAEEELKEAQSMAVAFHSEDMERRLLLVIQLANLARYKVRCTRSSPESQPLKGRKRSSKNESSPG